jgi:hypothetical protein
VLRAQFLSPPHQLPPLQLSLPPLCTGTFLPQAALFCAGIQTADITVGLWRAMYGPGSMLLRYKFPSLQLCLPHIVPCALCSTALCGTVSGVAACLKCEMQVREGGGGNFSPQEGCGRRVSGTLRSRG